MWHKQLEHCCFAIDSKADFRLKYKYTDRLIDKFVLAGYNTSNVTMIENTCTNTHLFIREVKLVTDYRVDMIVWQQEV